MKKNLALGVMFLLVFTACNSNPGNKEEKENTAAIEFDTKTYDFGEIPYEGNGRCYFTFTNSSDVPLVINVVRTTCGCTSPEWPEEPVEPGEEGKIGVTYNTRLAGKFRKTITVYSNAADSPNRLYIEGNVMKNNNKEN